jgi:hypothetical protein
MKTRRKTLSRSLSKKRVRKFTKRWLDSIDISEMALDGSDNNGGSIELTDDSGDIMGVGAYVQAN